MESVEGMNEDVAELVDATTSADLRAVAGDGEDVVETREATLTVTDYHVRVQHTGSHVPIDITSRSIRRVQLDLEVGRPALLAIVPDSGTIAPTVLSIERDQYAELAAAILHLAIDLADRGGGETGNRS
jgi:hypothetical protein